MVAGSALPLLLARIVFACTAPVAGQEKTGTWRVDTAGPLTVLPSVEQHAGWAAFAGEPGDVMLGSPLHPPPALLRQLRIHVGAVAAADGGKGAGVSGPDGSSDRLYDVDLASETAAHTVAPGRLQRSVRLWARALLCFGPCVTNPPSPPTPPFKPPPSPLAPPRGDGEYEDPSTPGSLSPLSSSRCSSCDSDAGCGRLLGEPRVQPLNDYRLIFMVKKGLDVYMEKNQVYVSCGDDYRLYSSPLIKFTKACYQLTGGNSFYLSVRIGYPCFGPPRRVGGKIVGYPAFGRWRVHNLYVQIYQPFSTVVQPYGVTNVYRF